MRIYNICIPIIILSSFFHSCKKYLDEKALKQIFIPSAIDDFQALLDNPAVVKSDPALLEILSDEYFITTTYWQGITPEVSSNYVWASNAVPYNNSWNMVYQQPVYTANVVLDYLSESSLPVDHRYNQIKGAALFYRASSFFNLAQLFALPYSNKNQNSLGIVLRIGSDINVKSTRSTIKETYEKIIDDLTEAAELLPITSELPIRPTKLSALAMLARIYLNIGDYENALKYSDLCLKQKGDLIDFNNLVPGVAIKSFNPEVISHSIIFTANIVSPSNAKIDTNLLSLYDVNDLRFSVYFRPNIGNNKGTYAFRGSYNGSEGVGSVFTGLTTAEMYLTRAECYARKGLVEAAISDLNILLERRYKKDSWSPIDYQSIQNPLEFVLNERRKELVFRGVRWMDLRRLNNEGANISLKRIIDHVEYILPPNDKRWVSLIPYDVINRTGMPQNPR